MKPVLKLLLATAVLVLLAACGGNARRVSPPSAAIQQLAVQPNGDWMVDLRLHNFSSVSMRFDKVRLEVSGVLQATPGISIGPGSADVVKVSMRPDGMSRIAVADALATRRSLSYRLVGTVDATPDEASKPRQFDVDDRSALNPAPGLDGVLR